MAALPLGGVHWVFCIQTFRRAVTKCPFCYLFSTNLTIHIPRCSAPKYLVCSAAQYGHHPQRRHTIDKSYYICQNNNSRPMPEPTSPLNLFIIYARADADALPEFKKSLTPLVRRGEVAITPTAPAPHLPKSPPSRHH